MAEAGDDLRQDLMTLQIIRLMDDMWLQKGLDLRLNRPTRLEAILEAARTLARLEAMVGAVQPRPLPALRSPSC